MVFELTYGLLSNWIVLCGKYVVVFEEYFHLLLIGFYLLTLHFSANGVNSYGLFTVYNVKGIAVVMEELLKVVKSLIQVGKFKFFFD